MWWAHSSVGQSMFWPSGELLRQAIIFVLKASKQAPWSEMCSAHTGCVKGHVLDLLIQYLFGDQILHFLVFWKPAGAEKFSTDFIPCLK